MNKESIKRNPLSVLALRLISPGYGHCSICGLPWNHCEDRVVNVSKYEGIFATCDYCWNKSSLERLKKEYSKLYRSWEKDGTIANINFTKETLLERVEKEYKREKNYVGE